MCMDSDEDLCDVEENNGYSDDQMQTSTRESVTPTTCQSPTRTAVPPNQRTEPFGGFDVLERYGRWLMSIPRDDIIALRQQDEYHDFLRAFERLGQRHRHVIAMNRTMMDLDTVVAPGEQPRARTFSFLQHMAVDDVILRVFEYLECHVLVRTANTCSRFRELANRSALQRTHDVAGARQLNDVMKLLRAKEQIDGVGSTLRHRSVPVPMLGLRKRVVVSNAGDPEYNGIYFCTGCNGNGFVFTKPRFTGQQETSLSRPLLVPQPVQPAAPVDGAHVQPPPVAVVAGNPGTAGTAAGDHDRRFLRCIIAKRFSNETILWYMSKEIQPASDENRTSGTAVGEVSQVFSFWAKLMVIGEASPDVCRYPSPSSILSRGGDPAWQPLSSTRTTHPPTVELVD